MAIINGTFLPDILNGTGDNDTINGYGSADIINGGGGDDVIDGGTGLDILSGGNGDDELQGGEGDDVLNGDDGNDILDGGVGVATLLSIYNGGTGNDLMIATVGAIAEDFDGGDGIDTLSFQNRAQGVTVNLELVSLPLLDTVRNTENIIGSAFADSITGDSNANRFTGGAGDDTLVGAGGNDTLDGGVGADDMIGGTGDDVYYIDNAGDVVTELDGEGNDTAYVSTDYTLGADSSIERVVFTGSGDLNVVGNAGDNSISGNAGDNRLEGGDGNDRLDGGEGADTMVGGDGNDRYIVDNRGDVIVENIDGGTDTVESSISFSIQDDQSIEKVILTGNADLNLTGNRYVNSLTGNDGNNLIDGRESADRMEGRGGDDIYIVDNVQDVTVEYADQGYDIVRSSVSFAITGQYIEELDLTGTGDIGARGNGLSNVLTGNDGSNRLNGDIGADVMTGGLGNDRYVVDNIGDVVVENANEGKDVVESSIDYVLGVNLEVLHLTGYATVNATGNAYDNELAGNNAANVLDGGAGADEMQGLNGDDHYFVDNVGDTVREIANQGYDVVDSSVTFSLASQYVEELHLTGSANINGTANNLNNVIYGNSGANSIRGMDGNDQIHGGFGNDTLQGGDGRDSFYFDTALSTASNVDRISDFKVADDTIYLDHAIFDSAGEVGTLAASAFAVGTGAHDADDRIIYNSASGGVYYDADGTGDGAAVLFAQVGTGLALSAADFVIV